MSVKSSQNWNPGQYSQNARFVSELGLPVVELLAPRAGERILDLGCGDGPLTRAITQAGCAVVGVDASPAMVDAARALGLEAHVMSGEALAFDQEFDAVFSNAALHWMKRPQAVISGVWRALKPRGRFVGEFGGRGNVAVIVSALEAGLARRGLDPNRFNPWYFPGPQEYGGLLREQGFTVSSIDLIPRPTPLPGDMRGWLETFAQSFTAALPLAEVGGYLDEVVESCRPALFSPEAGWTADYVRLRFAAHKP